MPGFEVEVLHNDGVTRTWQVWAADADVAKDNVVDSLVEESIHAFGGEVVGVSPLVRDSD